MLLKSNFCLRNKNHVLYFYGKEKLAPSPNKIDILRSLIGGTVSIFILLWLSKLTHNIFIMAPFGATCVLLYTVSQSPLAQPRNIIFGHLISAFVGLFFLKFVGVSILQLLFQWAVPLRSCKCLNVFIHLLEPILWLFYSLQAAYITSGVS